MQSFSSLEKLFTKLRTWYMERDDEASKWAVAYTYEAVNRHNPDRLKAHAAQGSCKHNDSGVYWKMSAQGIVL